MSPAESGKRRVACPCCQFLTLDQRGANDICQVCFWEDDGQDDPHADHIYGGPNGSLSLTAARANFALSGVCDERYAALVRTPGQLEYPTSESEHLQEE